ncbi:hypothetical protein GF391_00985 [Candidatus Uhrbacteria bacterium]|nr:hypothetical protein [Candidatus Uhrbacteria bacterium]
MTLTETQKKIIFIIFFVSFTIGTGYALYYFFFRTAAPVDIPTDEASGPSYTGTFGQTGERTPGQEPGTAPGQAAPLPISDDATAPDTEVESELLLDQVTQAASQSNEGRTRYYDPNDGRFYALDDEGNSLALSNRQFLNVDSVSWSKTTNQAILEFPDGSNISYDFDTDRQVTLPKHWEDFAFAPTDNKIVAKSIGLDQNNRYLIHSNADGTELTASYKLGDNADRVIPSWSPNNQVIAFSKTGDPQPDGAEEILLLGKNHQQFRPLKVAGKGFLPSWSPNGKQLLYSIYHERDQFKPMLWISDASGSQVGQNRRKLNINTWADKCAWADNTTVYCGVPISLPSGSALDRELVSSVSDDIYRIDLTNGTAQKINDYSHRYSISSPAVSPDGTSLTYTDTSSGKLYRFNF